MKFEQTAIHEAAHVVVGHVLGLTCEGLALTHHDVDETGAYGYADAPSPVFGYEHSSLQEQRSAVRAECIACCAGLAAEHVFFQVPLDIDNENAQADFQNIIECERNGSLRIRGKRSGCVGDDATWRYIERLLREACKLVRTHRSAIERLAEVLLERGTKAKIEGAEVEALLRGWKVR